MTKKRFTLGYVCGDFGLIDNDEWTDLHSMSENSEKNVRICINKLNELADENEQLKKELKIYHKVANCSNCAYHNYDWYVDDGYGGEEFEVCDKGNDMSDRICEDWEEL